MPRHDAFMRASSIRSKHRASGPSPQIQSCILGTGAAQALVMSASPRIFDGRSCPAIDLGASLSESECDLRKG